jgi:hypothetical protein
LFFWLRLRQKPVSSFPFSTTTNKGQSKRQNKGEHKNIIGVSILLPKRLIREIFINNRKRVTILHQNEKSFNSGRQELLFSRGRNQKKNAKKPFLYVFVFRRFLDHERDGSSNLWIFSWNSFAFLFLDGDSDS